jgi:toxin ParE1/3/4
MPQVLWTPVAESDLDDILFYIAIIDRMPATGERIYCEIRDKVAQQAKRPLMGHRHREAPEGWLYLNHKRWLVFYRPLPNGLEVMRIVDGVRDLPHQLRYT